LKLSHAYIMCVGLLNGSTNSSKVELCERPSWMIAVSLPSRRAPKTTCCSVSARWPMFANICWRVVTSLTGRRTSRAAAAASGVALTRASQVVPLTERGVERLPAVTMVDLRISRPIRLGQNSQFVPQLDIFNIGNAGTIVRYNVAVGGTYLTPAEIVAPRIVRVGFSLDF